MSHYRLPICTVFFIALLASACRHEPRRSFYYWKSVYHLSQTERSYMEGLHVTKLYVRFFDVDWDETLERPTPLAKIRFAEKISPSCEIVPVVYIVNHSLQKSKPQDITDLAVKILKLTDHISSGNNITFKELQMDCDWTDNTRDKYFTLLKVLKSRLIDSKKTLSATIRLHQVKYKGMTGVPPVDRGMLMYYNMGKLAAGASPNSVFNTNDASKYIDYLAAYPLQLDVALPAFSWGIHSRNNKIIELLNNIGPLDFEKNANFAPVGPSTFSVTQSFFFHGYYFMKNDVVKVEEITPAQCNTAARQLQGKLTKTPGTVAIFHLDSLILTHYEKQDFEKVFNTYR
jgi:hypothetical protein